VLAHNTSESAAGVVGQPIALHVRRRWPPGRPNVDRAVWPWRRSGNMGGMGDEFDDNPLEPAEELDSDEVRNDDGDEVVDPPDEWIEAKDDETLDERLAEEVPDELGDDEGDEELSEAHDSDEGGGLRLVSNLEIDHMDPETHGRERGQIDGTPEDGDSFFDVVE
jgi:hypothetical protein